MPVIDDHRGRRVNSVHVLAGVLLAGVVLQGVLTQWTSTAPRLQVASGAIAAFVSPGVVRRVLPRSEPAAVGVASLAGMALPGCECGAVPVSRRLVDKGAPVAAAVAFLLAAPAINPVVLASTAVAFPGEPEMVVHSVRTIDPPSNTYEY